MDQRQKALEFSRRHTGKEAFILPNAWDVVSARLLEQAGFKAIATASAAIAWAAGVPDGEEISRQEMIAIVGRIAGAVDVPVSADIERGYGKTPEEVGTTIQLIIEAGLVGANLEDGDGAGSVISRQEMAERIKAAAKTIERSDLDFVLNARVDNLYRDGESSQNIAEAIDRANAYLDAGASSAFVLTHGIEPIEQLARSINGPLNILAGVPAISLAGYQRMGVKRVTVGPHLLAAALGGLKKNANEMHEHGTFSFLSEGMPFGDLQELLAPTETGRSNRHSNPE